MGSCVGNSESGSSEIPPAVSTIAEFTADEWKNEIIKQRKKHSNVNGVEIVDDYQLYIQYLCKPQSLYYMSFIGIIARVTRQFIGDINGVEIYNDSTHSSDLTGHRIYTTIHPITGDIYIADDFSVYVVTGIKTLKLLATINEKDRNLVDDQYDGKKFHGLCFDGHGNVLLLEDKYTSVYFIDYNNTEKEMNQRINCSVPYDRKDITKYDTIEPSLYDNSTYKALVSFNIFIVDETLWALDIYNRNIYYLCDPSYDTGEYVKSVNIKYDDLSILILPIQYYNKIVMLDELMGQQKTCDDDKKAFSLENKINEIKAQLNEDKLKLEAIHLYKLLSLKTLWANRVMKNYHETLDENNYNKGHQRLQVKVLAFDVDKYYGAVYIVTNDYMFYKIEKISNSNVLYKLFNNQINVYEWKITHQASLRDVLPGGMPLGTCSIKYDSVTGRIIIADNYKIQALYI